MAALVALAPPGRTAPETEAQPLPPTVEIALPSTILGRAPTAIEARGTPEGGSYAWSANPPIVSFGEPAAGSTEVSGAGVGRTTLEVAYSTAQGVVTESVAVRVIDVLVDHRSRGGDRVVAARDPRLELPGGRKRLAVKIVQPQQDEPELVTLKLVRTTGATGSAVFEESGTDERIARFAEQEVVLLGREVSDAPRNVELQALTDGGHLLDGWSFTVFRVDVQAHVRGDVDQVLPAAARDGGGVEPGSLAAFLKDFDGDGEPDHERLGDNHIDDLRAYGGIVFSGRIVPSGIDPRDFNRVHSRVEAFNWDRRVSIRLYDQDGCANRWLPRFLAEDRTDDTADDDEDLIADPDIAGTGELYIWAIDTPEFLPSNVPKLGDVGRFRGQFEEVVTYAGVPVSETLRWYWRHSVRNSFGRFIRDDAVVEDNAIDGGTTGLTDDLQRSRNPRVEVTTVVPDTLEQGVARVAGLVGGTNLHLGGAYEAHDADQFVLRESGQHGRLCQPKVHLVRESPGPRGTRLSGIPMLQVTQVDVAEIKGEYRVGPRADLGLYDLKLVTMDRGASLPDAAETKIRFWAQADRRKRIRELLRGLPVEELSSLAGDETRAGQAAAAIVELGDYRAAAAASRIVLWLDVRDPRPRDPFSAEKRPWGRWYPAIRALRQIGEPSVEPILAAITDADRSWMFRRNAARCLARIFRDNVEARAAIVEWARERAATAEHRRRLAELAAEVPDVHDPDVDPRTLPPELQPRQ